MNDDLPSMMSLRAFETAAKAQSFKDAASILHVSASALSRQIQSLEEHLGVALFVRRNPGIELTRSGRLYLESVERVMHELRDAARALRATPTRALRISALESFCAKWLVPHLPEFYAAHPEIEIQLEATLRYADFDCDPVDVAIRFGTGPWHGLHAEPIVELDAFPVCSPALRDAEPPLREISDLARYVWIHATQTPDAWSDFVRATGHPTLRGRRDLHFDHVGIALSAAQSGQGIALSTRILCEPELADHRLCIPFDQRVRSTQTYHLVCKPEGLDDARIVALRDWLVAALG